MSEDSFILVNLKEEKAKKLAQVIGSNTARKILDFLSHHDHATASDIAKALKIPLSTSQYNIKHLVEAELVTNDEYHYSEKGREVDHYKLAHKMVIIAPAKTNIDSIKDKLKNVLPSIGICAGIAGAIHWLAQITPTSMTQLAQEAPQAMAAKRSAEIVAESMEMDTMVAEAVIESAPMAADEAVMAHLAEPIIEIAKPASAEPNIALWFFAGALCAIALYVVIEKLRKN